MANFSTTTGFAWNNIYEVFDSIARALLERGHSVYLSFATIEGPCGKIPSVPESRYFRLRPPGSGLRELWRLSSVIVRHRIRYLYLTDSHSAHWSYLLLRVLGVRAILVHNRVSVADPRPAGRDPFPTWVLKHLFSRIPGVSATRIYAVSDFVRQRLLLRARIPASRVVTILNGVDLKRFTPRSTSGGQVKIFAGARASHHKGIQVLIEASAILRERGNRDFRVVYAGDGPYLTPLKELASERGLTDTISFLGETRSTDDLVAEADIVVVPSIWGDACPSSVSEALAAGKPLVTTEAGGIPQIVGEEGNAIVVPCSDPAALALALEDLIASPDRRAKLGARARARAEAALTKERYHREVVDQFLRDIAPFAS